MGLSGHLLLANKVSIKAVGVGNTDSTEFGSGLYMLPPKRKAHLTNLEWEEPCSPIR